MIISRRSLCYLMHAQNSPICFASAVMNVIMLTMISLVVVVKDVAIEKEEGELIATPAVDTLISHIIINHSSSSSSCCKVRYCIVVLIRVSVSIHRSCCCNKRTITIITHLQYLTIIARTKLHLHFLWARVWREECMPHYQRTKSQFDFIVVGFFFFLRHVPSLRRWISSSRSIIISSLASHPVRCLQKKKKTLRSIASHWAPAGSRPFHWTCVHHPR